MADPRFFTVAGPFALKDLALIAHARLSPGSDPDRLIRDVGPLESAGPDCLTFLDNRKYADAFARSGAGACCVRPEQARNAPPGMALLLTPEPYKAYALAARAFYPTAKPAGVVSPSAHIDASASIGEGSDVAPGAVILAGATIGRRCRIGPNAVIGANVVVGDDTVIGANTSLSHCLVGARVYLYPGVRIGQEGFGFAIDPDGHIPVPQLGRVIIEDDVEIGANSTVDRGAGPDTVIGRGCMIDNLVQIGHNVHLGPGCILVAQSGVAGSTKLDHHVVLAAQAGIIGHLRIGAGARIGAQSGVIEDVEPGAEIGGTPAVSMRQWLRQVALLRRLARGKSG
jgi:UDP-3-O-[3-hydroxymyristoyl] glucosamine N-acyltransferase